LDIPGNAAVAVRDRSIFTGCDVLSTFHNGILDGIGGCEDIVNNLDFAKICRGHVLAVITYYNKKNSAIFANCLIVCFMFALNIANINRWSIGDGALR
jgi:hypothetical protein